ncbi:MAG: hypothetical protein J6S96_01345 [Muribaculaceae bacterium]|nr:hypothetical protein [Muribaculaceae bacterium]
MSQAKKRNTSRPDYIQWILIVGAVISITVLAGLLARRYIFHPNVNVDHYPVKGIDVSGHNTVTDWNKVASSGITFVFIKASEGASYKNPLFSKQFDGARSAGLKVGCYHFFRKNRDGVSQASHFLATLGNRHTDLPLVVDVEDWDNDKNIDNTTTCQRLKDMVSTLERHGHKVMIYTNGNGYKTYYKPLFEGYDLWLSSFNSPETMISHNHIIQQYSHWGSIDGIKGDVDMNIFIGSKREWDDWLDKLND